MKYTTYLLHLCIGLFVIFISIYWPPFNTYAQKISNFLSHTIGEGALFFIGPVQLVFFSMGTLTGILHSNKAFWLSFLQVLPYFILIAFLNFSDSPRYLKYLYGFSLIAASLLGAYIGICLKRIRSKQV